MRLPLAKHLVAKHLGTIAKPLATPKQGVVMATIVVKNVPRKIGTYSIKNMCRSHGAVEKVQKHNGIITVEMPEKEAALLVLKKMKGQDFLGHRLSVTIEK